MKIFLDAGYLIYLNINVQDDRIEKLLEQLLTDIPVIDEVLYISKNPYEETIKFCG